MRLANGARWRMAFLYRTLVVTWKGPPAESAGIIVQSIFRFGQILRVGRKKLEISPRTSLHNCIR